MNTCNSQKLSPLALIKFICLLSVALIFAAQALAQQTVTAKIKLDRERISINEGWKFYKYDAKTKPDSLIYDVRPEVNENIDNRAADARPTEAVKVKASQAVLKSWILPSGNSFIKNPSKRYKRPEGNPGSNFPFVQPSYDDDSWESLTLPHDWAIKGPFYEGWGTEIGGGMGRLPVHGVAWYRRKLEIPVSDAGKSIFLEVEGAMSYAMVWLNGKLVGGWPYGYTSFQLDLTPYIIPGKTNQLAVRVDNPPSSSRWYPGGGIYRNVWLIKTNPIHIGQWGTSISTRNVSKSSATIDLKVTIDNEADKSETLNISTEIYALSPGGIKTGKAVATIKHPTIDVKSKSSTLITGSASISNPRLWGPVPDQIPHRYVAVTMISSKNGAIDRYETVFGIRDLRFDASEGLFVNNKHVYIKGVNQHHDLGALGAAFNVRAAERQLEMLREMGCNAIRLAHNPPAPELLDLTDRMGFLVVDEIFDAWELKKTPLDFHLIFPDWHEQDLRALIRRDRNHPSVIMWSFGNEVGEQYTGEQGAVVAERLNSITKDEDPTRPTTLSMNYAKPHMPLPAVVDIISLNYQGEGIRNAPAYSGLKGINTPPLFPAFREKFPNKMILSSENAAALSSRGEYMFPVTHEISSPIKDGIGGDSKKLQVSAYELYSVDFGSSADKVFASMAKHPFVAGGFVWSGWDYLGEPTPYYLARSSYFGIIDLAGFKKDRFYLYQSQWRPELPMAHILPHWNWPDRNGEITPVHVFTSGDEAELFLNGQSLGRKKLGQYEYRLRWDSVKYSPGEIKVIAYKQGKRWAENTVKTTSEASKLKLSADRAIIRSDGNDLSFVTLSVTDKNGLIVPQAKNAIEFSIDGPGDIVATDNGDAANLVSFASPKRDAFNGLCLVIVRGRIGKPGIIKLKAKSNGLETATISIKTANSKF